MTIQVCFSAGEFLVVAGVTVATVMLLLYIIFAILGQKPTSAGGLSTADVSSITTHIRAPPK